MFRKRPKRLSIMKQKAKKRWKLYRMNSHRNWRWMGLYRRGRNSTRRATTTGTCWW